MKRFVKLTFSVVSLALFFAIQSFSQDIQPAPKPTPIPTPLDKKELRQKACGTEKVNYSAKTDKTQHPTPEAPTDQALIYVIRSSMLGYKIDSKLAVDGKWMGVNRGKTYFYFTLEPGEHYFCSESENQDYLALTVEAGKTYYLHQQVEMGAWKARTKLVVISETEGKKKLEDVHLSVFEEKPKKND